VNEVRELSEAAQLEAMTGTWPVNAVPKTLSRAARAFRGDSNRHGWAGGGSASSILEHLSQVVMSIGSPV
jgi:hypothetical protein